MFGNRRSTLKYGTWWENYDIHKASSLRSSHIWRESQGPTYVLKFPQTEQSDWPTKFTAFAQSPYFAFQRVRQGVSNVDTPEVRGAHVCICVCVSVFIRECVCKWKMWLELRPTNCCLLAAWCFDSHVGLCTQWCSLWSGAFFPPSF